MERARLVISPTIPRLTWPAILAWIWRMLRSVELASVSISVTIQLGIVGRPRCFPRASAALMPAVTRSLISDETVRKVGVPFASGYNLPCQEHGRDRVQWRVIVELSSTAGA